MYGLLDSLNSYEAKLEGRNDDAFFNAKRSEWETHKAIAGTPSGLTQTFGGWSSPETLENHALTDIEAEATARAAIPPKDGAPRWPPAKPAGARRRPPRRRGGHAGVYIWRSLRGAP